MEEKNDVDFDKLIQEELDALDLDDSVEENVNETVADEDEEELLRTQRDMERQMQERLLAFENEVKTNLDRYEIDYKEIDELLQKPIGTDDDEIQTNVARECGIEREELDRILQSINTEESRIESRLSEHNNESIDMVEQSLPTSGTDESVEPTPRKEEEEKEDTNKKLHDERLAESHRRMLDELALLEQRRKEEEERYATVLQEQQTRLAEEYRRLQNALDESARQTQNERRQFEELRREQERLTNERRTKMATLIQAWYRGRRAYRQYHGEIIKRATPALKAIVKKRKKKAQEEAAKVAELTKIQEIEPEVKPKPEIIPVKEEVIKKKKAKPVPKPVLQQPSTQIVQMENPADFVPTIIPQQRKSSTPRLTRIERILSPVQPSLTLPQTPPPPPINRESFSATIARVESPAPPPIDPTPTIETFEAEPEKISPPPKEQQADVVVSKPQTPPMEPEPTYPEDQPILVTDTLPVPIPHKISNEGKHPIKAIYSFLNEARRWAQQTQEITYSTLMFATEEILQQIPTRKPAGTLRKLPDIDSQTLIKAANAQLPGEIRFLLLEQLLTPCSLSLVGNTYPNLTHLTLRQCKLVQLAGLESCSSLMILDIEGNWLEQIHLQLHQLQYLNVSRNRLTSLLSIHTPRLKYLDVSKNRLTRLNGLETLTNLNILLATSNQLLTTIGLQGCTHLLHIDVSDNHLVEMEQLDQCPLLITMKAISNALIQIPCLYNAVLLHELDLSANSLTSFDDLSLGSWLPFLTHLQLANNSLQELSMIKLPALLELDLAFNQISDISTVKRWMKICPFLSRINLEQNPVLHDVTESLEMKSKAVKSPLTLLPQSSTGQSTESIELYLNFLATITSMLVTLRQTIEQHQIEPFDLMETIHHHCQQYHEHKIIEPIPQETPPPPTKVVSSEEQSLIRLQAHWRRRLVERKFDRQHRAARMIQARWRGYATRQRMGRVRRLHREQYPMYEEIDLSQFDFDEAAFDARFQRPRTPKTHARQVWQPQPHIPLKPMSITELSQTYSPRSSSAASSHAKPLVEPLAMPSRTNAIAQEWGFTPSSTTAALMLKRAERMKWNVERKHKREHMDAYQRLKVARNNEQPPGSLRLTRRQQQALVPPTKAVVNTKHFSPPSTIQSRSDRAFEWVHTQVARFDESSVRDVQSPRYERKRLPSLDGSVESNSRMRSNETQQQQQRWPTSSVSIRQPPSLLPPISGHFPRV